MMLVVGNFLIALAKVADVVLTVFYWLILIRALISWVNPDPFNPVVQFLYHTTEPVLEPLRRFLPATGVDLSPLIAFLILIFIKSFLVNTLYDTGVQLKLKV